MITNVINTLAQPEAGTKLGAEIIRRGGLVAFPTETVYGLGANGLDGNAVDSIFEAKGRPSDNPLILHVSKKNDVKQLWLHKPKFSDVLMDTFWPGPLTLVAPCTNEVPSRVTAGLDTVAVRMPADKTARALIAKAGVPIAAPSANLSGRPSPTRASDVLNDLDGKIPLILDGGPCKYGVESTVLSLVGAPTILRPGAVTKEMLEAVIGQVLVSKSILTPMGDNETPASPGMKYKHYAPEAEVVCVRGGLAETAREINKLYIEAELQGRSCKIFATEQTKMFYKGKKYVILGDRTQAQTLCANLFSALRDTDQQADFILTECIDTVDYGLAYMNRLLRAAGFQVIDV